MADKKTSLSDTSNGSPDQDLEIQGPRDTIELVAEIQGLLRKQHYARAADVFGALIDSLRGEGHGLDISAAQLVAWVERVKELQARCLVLVLRGHDDEDLIGEFVELVDNLGLTKPRSCGATEYPEGG